MGAGESHCSFGFKVPTSCATTNLEGTQVNDAMELEDLVVDHSAENRPVHAEQPAIVTEHRTHENVTSARQEASLPVLPQTNSSDDIFARKTDAINALRTSSLKKLGVFT